MARRIFGALLLAGALCISASGQTANVPALDVRTADQMVAKLPQPTGYVSDLAGVIDAASKEQIEELCTQLDHQAHAQIAVVTIDTIGSNSIEEFSTAIYDKWKIGPKSTDKGILMLFAVKEHKRRIEVGPGLQGILNDAKVGDIGRSMVPQLKQGQYGPAIQGGVQQLSDIIAADAGVTLAAQSGQPEQHTYHREAAPQHGIRLFSILRIAFFIIILISAIAGRGRGGNGWLWFILGNMMGGGGGRGGGGGDGGGGGGGGFGGFGGGGSDGGGASGDW